MPLKSLWICFPLFDYVKGLKIMHLHSIMIQNSMVIHGRHGLVTLYGDNTFHGHAKEPFHYS